jgi:dienelactone hydrolase
MIQARRILMAAFVTMVTMTANARDRAVTDELAAMTNRHAPAAANCLAPFRVGYRVARFGTITAAVWYPTTSREDVHPYTSGFKGAVARSGEPLGTCGPFPLVVFSHGLGGCGIQSIFFTETLARHGYVVVAPDHSDALCSVEGTRPASSTWGQQTPVWDPAAWNHNSHVDRRNDIGTILNTMLGESAWKNWVAADRVGIVGHSVGGYVALGMVGGWKEWNDPRIKVALLFSPYSLPFSIRNTLHAIRVPLMFQGADFDLGITTFIEGPQGAYAHSNAPKYFAKLRAGNHFIWTNLQCAGAASVETCIRTRPEAQLINAYGVAFLDYYLKGVAQPLLWRPNPALSEYVFER